MRIIEPTGAFKVLGGNLVLHCGLFVGLIILNNSKHFSYNKQRCEDHEAAKLVNVLIISHAVSAIISLLNEIASVTRTFSVSVILDIVQIATYFYVIMYVLFGALELKDSEGCISGSYLLDQALVHLSLIVFAYWVLSNIIFLIFLSLLSYTS